MENMDIELLDPSTANKEIFQSDYTNPFYLPESGSELKYAKMKFLSEDYKNIYILCLPNDFEPNVENLNKIKLFYEIDSDVPELTGQSKLVTLVRGPFSLLYLITIRGGLLSVENKVLEKFNHNCYELGNKELVFMMLQVKESTVKDWVKLYDPDNNFDKFVEQKILSSYYDLRDNKLDENLLNLVGQISSFKYWQDDKNCSLSINKAFGERKFNLNFLPKWNLPVEEIEKELQNLLQNFATKKANIKKNGYPEEITNPKVNESEESPLKMKTYVDASKTDNYSFYRITKPEELVISREGIEEMLIGRSLCEKEKYYLICNLLISKDYCHYVLGNSKILNATKDIFEKYKPIFRYLMGYAWVSLYMEESIRKTKIKESDRFVFDIETASCLPVFPFCHEAPFLNPYFTCMVSEKLINMGQNINGVRQPVDYQNGIIDVKELERRLNIFISGKSDNDLLTGADWSNMVITGGIMSAILPKTNPLMALFTQGQKSGLALTDNELYRFFMEYYPLSDIDIACNHSNILNFIDHVKNLRAVIVTNLGETVKESDIRIKPNKTLAICINSHMLKEKCDRGEVPFSYDYIFNNKGNDVVKFYFYELYVKQKNEINTVNKKILGDKIYEREYFEIINYCKLKKTSIIINDKSFESDIVEFRTPESNSGIQMVYYMGNGVNDTDENKNNIFIKFSETLKFKILGKQLKHPFEVFRINGEEFFSTVGRFHEPCVRSYIRNKNCYLLPSSIIAYQLFENIDFKYFVGSHDPISIINKYRNRGYGTIFNQLEVNQFLSYVLAFDYCKKAYGVVDKKDIKNIVGAIDLNNDFFKPRKVMPEEFPVDTSLDMNYNNTKLEYFNNKDDILKYYKKKYPQYSQEFVTQRTIDENGKIIPVKKWMIDAAYDLLN